MTIGLPCGREEALRRALPDAKAASQLDSKARGRRGAILVQQLDRHVQTRVVGVRIRLRALLGMPAGRPVECRNGRSSA